MIIVVSDVFSDQYVGGAELTTDALINQSLQPTAYINSKHLTIDTIHNFKDKEWIFGNFSQVPQNLLVEIIKNVKNYSVIEYDYKYCMYRSTHKHIFYEGECNCENSTHGKLVSVFLKKANNIFWMSEAQKNEYMKVFPFLSAANNFVINSSFGDETLNYIKSLDATKKNNKYIIFNSNSWIKGVQECINYAKENNLDYELVSGISHKEFLRKLAVSKGLIFFPLGLDTCPRVTMEAKLLGCELILNENVQQKDEKWFVEGKIEEHILKNRKLFFDRCLDPQYINKKYDENIKFHFIIPCYNTEKWIPKTIECIRTQKNKNFTATIIDDISTDNTFSLIQKGIKGDKRFNVIKNKTKNFALKNISLAIKAAPISDEDVVIVLDGDDWLPSTDVLNYLTKVYNEEDVLLTYGSYEEFPSGERGVEPSPYPNEVIKNNSFRGDMWRASHLRTFKYKLWKQIDQKDLIDNDGEYYKMAYDQAMMLPMLEMAGQKIRYIDEVLHVYNRVNPLNVDKQKAQEQFQTMKRIRAKKPYSRVY